MKTLTCQCGAVIQLTEPEYLAAAGKQMKCSACGRVKRLLVLPATKSHRRKRWIVPALIVLIVIFSAAAWLTFGTLKATVLNRVAPEPYQVAVRAWLKENLESKDWEEVRWWPPVEVTDQVSETKANAREIDLLNQDIADTKRKITASQDDDYVIQMKRYLETREDMLAQLKAWKYEPVMSCRLKCRSGGMLHDDVFELKDGKAKPGVKLRSIGYFHADRFPD